MKHKKQKTTLNVTLTKTQNEPQNKTKETLKWNTKEIFNKS